MKHLNTFIICNCLVRVAAFICITVAALQLNKVGILWFYLVPLFMGIVYKGEKK